MQSDAELFGLNKKRKLKFGESGTEDSDYEPVMEGAEQVDAPAKVPQSFNETAQTSQPKPVGDPVVGQSASTAPSDIAPTVPATSKPSSTLNTDGYAAPLVTTNRSGAPAGYDSTKWNSADHQTPKYAVSGIVADAIGRGAKDVTPELVAEISKAYPGTTMIDAETVDIPGVGPIRVMNEGELRWDVPGAAGASAGGAEPSLVDLIASGGQATAPTTGASSMYGGINDELANLLAGGVDADPAVSAFRRSTSRDFGRLRAQEAEQAALNGTIGSGGQDGRIRQLKENEAEAVAGFTGDRAADIQRLKVQSDQALRSLGFNYAQLDQQQRQWLGNLNQNRDQFLASLGLSERQLNAQQKQALDQLGLAYDQLEYQGNRDATLAALG